MNFINKIKHFITSTTYPHSYLEDETEWDDYYEISSIKKSVKKEKDDDLTEIKSYKD